MNANTPGVVADRFAERNIEISKDSGVDRRLGHSVSRSDIRTLLRIHSAQGLSSTRNLNLASHRLIVGTGHFLDSVQTEIVATYAHRIARLHFDVLLGLKARDQGDADDKHRDAHM